MGVSRMLTDFRDLRQALKDLLRESAAELEAASFEITASARRFARRSRAVVDDKLSFSATLMRAGEVDAAGRLLAEAEHEIRTEEAALMERVNEIHVAHVMRRERITRLRLARTMAVALVGSVLMAFSAAGISLASMLAERFNSTPVALAPIAQAEEVVAAPEQEREARESRAPRSVRDLKLKLSPDEFQEYLALTSGPIDAVELQAFLLDLDLSVALVEQVVSGEVSVEAVKEKVDDVPALVVEKPKKKAKKAARQAQQEPATDDTTDDQNEPEESPSPTPSDDGGDPNESDDNEEIFPF
ncbi:MAG TPA: hypothetical protein VHJ82_10880 [Actinomycetota bacterium]|nr:hypothetical protein [Actinomycetota bacterium]